MNSLSNVLLSIVAYVQCKRNIKKFKVEWTPIDNWDKYKFLLSKSGRLYVCFSDKSHRVGNFFYGYPNKNLQFAFFASVGCMPEELTEINKLEWLVRWLKNES